MPRPTVEGWYRQMDDAALLAALVAAEVIYRDSLRRALTSDRERRRDLAFDWDLLAAARQAARDSGRGRLVDEATAEVERREGKT